MADRAIRTFAQEYVTRMANAHEEMISIIMRNGKLCRGGADRAFCAHRDHLATVHPHGVG